MRNTPPVSFLKKSPLVAAILGLFVTTLIIAISLFYSRQTPIDPRLASPVSLLEKVLKANRPIFITPDFFPFVSAIQKKSLPSSNESESAAREKSAFWRLNRERHFSAVLLGMNPAWHSLSASLLNSSLWVLSDVSPWGYCFYPKLERTAEWQPSSQEQLVDAWPNANDRTRFLALTAGSLIAINRLEDAELLLNQAEATHRLSALVQATRASLAAARGKWEEAKIFAKDSLHADHANRAAREILIRALTQTGNTDESLNQARKLVDQNGADEETLFLLARAASAANSGKEECEALSRLVSAGRRDHQPLGASLTYLGQAYAKQGDRGDALRAFQEAALAPEISPEEHRVIRELMDHLMEGDRSSSTLPALPESKASSSMNP